MPPSTSVGSSGTVEGSKIIEETVGGRSKYRARLPCGTITISGPLRLYRDTAEQDLAKMEEALTSDGLRAVQKIQPELFRCREKRLPNK